MKIIIIYINQKHFRWKINAAIQSQ